MLKRALPILVLLGVTGVSLVLVALPLDRGPFQGSPQTGEGRFWDSGRQIHASGLLAWKSDPTTSPLYSLVLSPFATSELGSVSAARRMLVIFTLPLMTLLVTALAWRGYGPWPAVVSGAAVLLCAPIVLDAGTFTPAVPAVLLALGVLLLLSFRTTFISCALVGLLLAAVVRFLPVLGWTLALSALIAIALLRDGPRWPRVAVCMGTLLIATGVLDVSGRTGSAFPTTSVLDVYRGHRAPASGVTPRRGDTDDRSWWGPIDYLREASREKNARLTPPAASVYWLQRAVVESVTHPLDELRRSGVKLLATFQADPMPRGVSAAFLIDRAENPWPLRVTTWISRLLLPLGLVGLIAGLSRALRQDGGIRVRTTCLLALGAVAGWLSASVTFADADHRLLSVLCLCGGLAPFMALARTRWRMTVAGALASVLALGFLPVWGAVPGLGIMYADHLEVGALYDREGRGSAAMREYERAVRQNRNDPYPRFAIAGLFARDNVVDQAIAELEHLRENHADFVPGLQALASLYQNQERWVEAAALHGELTQLEPWNPEHFNNLGTMYAQVGYYDLATRALETAVALDPTYQVARDNLEGLRGQGLAPGAPAGADPLRVTQEHILGHLRSGNLPEAKAELDSAYTRFGRDRFELHFLEGTLLLLSGDPVASIPLLESAVKHMQANVPVLANLGTAYARAGRLEDARRIFKEALRIQPANLQIQQSLKGLETTLDSLQQSGR